MSNVREVWAELHRADPDGNVELKIPLETTLGRHSQVDEICAYGRYLGLTVDKESAGNWFNKVHYIKASGRVKDAIKLVDHVLAITEAE